MPTAGRVGVRFKIEGVEAVAKAFRELEPKLARKVVRQAERAALQPIKQAIVAAAPVRTGDLRRSVRIRTAKGPRSGGKKSIAMGVLVGGGSKGKAGKKTNKVPWWAFLQEWGWIVGKRIRSGGKIIGRQGSGRKIPGKHFTRKAMRAHESQAQKIMTARILQGIENLANK